VFEAEIVYRFRNPERGEAAVFTAHRVARASRKPQAYATAN